MQTLKNILTVTFPAFLFTCIVLEFFFRWVIPASNPPMGFFDEKEKIYSFSNEKQEGTITIGRFAQIRTTWRINNRNWNYPIDYHRIDNKNLIAVIGDSYIEAFQVDVDQNYPYLLKIGRAHV